MRMPAASCAAGKKEKREELIGSEGRRVIAYIARVVWYVCQMTDCCALTLNVLGASTLLLQRTRLVQSSSSSPIRAFLHRVFLSRSSLRQCVVKQDCVWQSEASSIEDGLVDNISGIGRCCNGYVEPLAHQEKVIVHSRSKVQFS